MDVLPAVATEAVANIQKEANMAIIYSRQSSVLETLEEFRVGNPIKYYYLEPKISMFQNEFWIYHTFKTIVVGTFSISP